MNALAGLFQDARTAKGLSLKRTSDLSGASQPTVRELERYGPEGVTLRAVAKIAQTLDVDPDAVFNAVHADMDAGA